MRKEWAGAWGDKAETEREHMHLRERENTHLLVGFIGVATYQPFTHPWSLAHGTSRLSSDSLAQRQPIHVAVWFDGVRALVLCEHWCQWGVGEAARPFLSDSVVSLPSLTRCAAPHLPLAVSLH